MSVALHPAFSEILIWFWGVDIQTRTNKQTHSVDGEKQIRAMVMEYYKLSNPVD